ncbi:MAG: phosphoglycerate dehydrogenase [Thermodesulfobacteriota bacterium]
MKILITDGLSQEGLNVFKSYPELEVDIKKDIGKEELLGIVSCYEGLIVRSGTKVTKDVIEAGGGRLKVIGRAGIGVDNVDVKAATKKGIVVMNTPEANAITTAEHTIALMFALVRNIPQAHFSLKSGEWKRELFKGTELYQKTLGIIGLGKIGRLVAERAMGIKMEVIAYDPFLSDGSVEKLGIEPVSLEGLMSRADVITVHTPLTSDTKNMINTESISKMKRGVIIINCARGGIVNEADLARALRSGYVGGASIDVYEKEPPDKTNPLFSIDSHVVHTPHLGASTAEAQAKVGVAMAEQIVDFFKTGEVRNAVNMPSVSREIIKVLKPYLVLSEKLGKLMGQICRSGIKEISIEYSGEAAEYDTKPLTVSFMKGFLTPIMDIPINHVNALVIAGDRGISLVESKHSKPEDYTSLITVNIRTDKARRSVAGTVFGENELRIVSMAGFSIDAVPEGCLLVSENYDVPGVIGSLCTKLGELGINIGRMHLGRESLGGKAIALINIDSPVPDDVVVEISKLPNIINVTQVEL